MKMRTVIALLIVLSVVSIFNPLTSSAQDSYIYWVHHWEGEIARVNLDGTNLTILVRGLERPINVALDMVGGKMYWTSYEESTGSKIYRANLNGTNIETLLSGEPSVTWGIQLDTSGGKIYWTVWSNNDDPGGNKIQRANLDGSNVENLVSVPFVHFAGYTGPRDIVLDLSRGKMYWTDYGGGKVQRANLDGTNTEDIITGLSGPHDLALDFSNDKIYFSLFDGKIQRANFDGSHLEDVVFGLNPPFGIQFDNLNGKMYWVSPDSDSTFKIVRANLDETDLEDIVTGLVNGPERFTLGILQTDGLRFDPNVIDNQTFRVNTPIEPLSLPPAEGGTEPYTYTLDPIPAGLSFDAGTQMLSGVPTTLGDTVATYTATDATGASASLTFTIMVEVNLDVNADGQVDVLDLVWVAVSYGMRGPALPADVNADGVVNVQDLVAVAAGIDAADALPAKIAEEVALAAEAAAAAFEGIAGAPVIGFSNRLEVVSGATAHRNVAAALADVRSLAGSDVRLGKCMPLLEELLQALAEMKAIPQTTALLPNYPNPFNPETWIPYHLATDAEVTLTIYDIRGVAVRQLVLGHQPAGVYESRGRAAYWDGRNQIGETVASGLYFYTLTAGDFNATRKLLIAK